MVHALAVILTHAILVPHMMICEHRGGQVVAVNTCA